jgi:hypothetical protein
MAPKGRKRAFDEPIALPGSGELVTLEDAGAYITELPKADQQLDEWQTAIEALMIAAEDRRPLMHAHVGMMVALHGAKSIPEYDSSKEKHWGRRKLKRDEWRSRRVCVLAASPRVKSSRFGDNLN